MKNRQMQSLALTATAALLLAACSSGSQDSGTKSGATSSAAPVTIDYIHRLPDGPGMTAVADIVAKWNAAHPDIQVKATKFDGKAADLTTKLEADIKAGTAPCLAQVGYADVPSMFVKGDFVDVSSEAAHYKDHFAPGAYSLMGIGGKQVGLPQDTGPLVYYYNKAAFADLGLQVPTTAADFTAAAAKAAKAGKYIADFEPDEAQFGLSAEAAAAGATWYSTDGDKWKVDTTSGGTAAIASFWQTMLDAKSVLTEDRWGDGFAKALNDQKLIGTIGAAWEAPLLSDAMKGSANVGQWAVTQIPQLGSQPMTGPDGGSGVAVLKGCQHPQQAMEFNDWFNTQIDDLVSQGLVVAAKGTMKTPAAVSSFYGGQDVFAELEKANQAMSPDFPYIPGFGAIGTDVGAAAANAASGTGKVADIFQAAQSASVKALKDAGLPVAE